MYETRRRETELTVFRKKRTHTLPACCFFFFSRVCICCIWSDIVLGYQRHRSNPILLRHLLNNNQRISKLFYFCFVYFLAWMNSLGLMLLVLLLPPLLSLTHVYTMPKVPLLCCVIFLFSCFVPIMRSIHSEFPIHRVACRSVSQHSDTLSFALIILEMKKPNNSSSSDFLGLVSSFFFLLLCLHAILDLLIDHTIYIT